MQAAAPAPSEAEQLDPLPCGSDMPVQIDLTQADLPQPASTQPQDGPEAAQRTADLDVPASDPATVGAPEASPEAEPVTLASAKPGAQVSETKQELSLSAPQDAPQASQHERDGSDAPDDIEVPVLGIDPTRQGPATALERSQPVQGSKQSISNSIAAPPTVAEPGQDHLSMPAGLVTASQQHAGRSDRHAEAMIVHSHSSGALPTSAELSAQGEGQHDMAAADELPAHDSDEHAEATMLSSEEQPTSAQPPSLEGRVHTPAAADASPASEAHHAPMSGHQRAHAAPPDDALTSEDDLIPLSALSKQPKPSRLAESTGGHTEAQQLLAANGASTMGSAAAEGDSADGSEPSRKDNGRGVAEILPTAAASKPLASPNGDHPVEPPQERALDHAGPVHALVAADRPPPRASEKLSPGSQQLVEVSKYVGQDKSTTSRQAASGSSSPMQSATTSGLSREGSRAKSIQLNPLPDTPWTSLIASQGHMGGLNSVGMAQNGRISAGLSMPFHGPAVPPELFNQLVHDQPAPKDSASNAKASPILLTDLQQQSERIAVKEQPLSSPAENHRSPAGSPQASTGTPPAQGIQLLPDGLSQMGSQLNPHILHGKAPAQPPSPSPLPASSRPASVELQSRDGGHPGHRRSVDAARVVEPGSEPLVPLPEQVTDPRQDASALHQSQHAQQIASGSSPAAPASLSAAAAASPPAGSASPPRHHHNHQQQSDGPAQGHGVCWPAVLPSAMPSSDSMQAGCMSGAMSHAEWQASVAASWRQRQWPETVHATMPATAVVQQQHEARLAHRLEHRQAELRDIPTSAPMVRSLHPILHATYLN